MNLAIIKMLPKTIGKFMSKNAPTIGLVIGIGGAVGAVALAIKATPKAVEVIEEENLERENKELEPMTKVEVVAKCWKFYVPTATTLSLSIASMIMSHNIQARRSAALMAAYALNKEQFKKYKEETEKLLPKGKIEQLRENIDKATLDAAPPWEDDQVINTGKGNTRCYDSYLGRYFLSSIEEIRKKINEANAELLRGDFFSLNELYYLWGLPGCKAGNDIGWRNGDGLIDVTFGSQLDENDNPCLVINYGIEPKSYGVYY